MDKNDSFSEQPPPILCNSIVCFGLRPRRGISGSHTHTHTRTPHTHTHTRTPHTHTRTHTHFLHTHHTHAHTRTPHTHTRTHTLPTHTPHTRTHTHTTHTRTPHTHTHHRYTHTHTHTHTLLPACVSVSDREHILRVSLGANVKVTDDCPSHSLVFTDTHRRPIEIDTTPHKYHVFPVSSYRSVPRCQNYCWFLPKES